MITYTITIEEDDKGVNMRVETPAGPATQRESDFGHMFQKMIVAFTEQSKCLTIRPWAGGARDPARQ